jgi:lipopolysaccharide/colanic/teichoic acid biosynthesis glycosyltransferase
MNEFSLLIKRIFDIFAALSAIIILSPVFLFVGVLIKITSRGPVFFTQKRVGLNGRQFMLYKFRTMHEDAQKKRFDMEKYNELDGPAFKIKNDPRIEPLGKLFRKLSLDELPQFFHILVGQMSFVGPRPLPCYEIRDFGPWQRRRLSMRPGLTCLWQIRGRSKVDFSQWMSLDLEYVDTWSLTLDFYILFKTIPVVLFGIGAY